MDQVMFQHVKVHRFERGPAEFVTKWKVCAAELYSLRSLRGRVIFLNLIDKYINLSSLLAL